MQITRFHFLKKGRFKVVYRIGSVEYTKKVKNLKKLKKFLKWKSVG
jgi:hypothetical protein